MCWRAWLLSFGLLLMLGLPPMVKAQADPEKKERLDKVRDQNIPGYTVSAIKGFTTVISDEAMKMHRASKLARKPLKALELELSRIENLLPEKTVDALRTVPIWVEWDDQLQATNGRRGWVMAVYYGGHQLSMLRQGQHPLKAKCVTLLRLRRLTAEHQPERDSGRCVLLHELAHAVHSEVLGRSNPSVKLAYQQAMERKLYDPKMYATTNEMEFFAEFTCSYFNQLNYFPRTRSQLAKHDPSTYQLMRRIWGNNPLPESLVKTADLDVRLGDIRLGTPIDGSELGLADLEGKPLLVVLWNANSTSSLVAFPQLKRYHQELGLFGLQIVAVHRQSSGTSSSSSAEEVARGRQLPFLVTQSNWLRGGLVEDFNDFPLGLVFDPEGNCRFRGSPMEAERAVLKAVGVHLRKPLGEQEPTEKMADLIDMLQAGQRPTLMLQSLVPLSKSADHETKQQATAILQAALEPGKQALHDAALLSRTDPVAAYRALKPLLVLFQGTSVAATANAYRNQLETASPAVRKELLAIKLFENVDKIERKLAGRPGSFDPTQPKFQIENQAMLAALAQAIERLRKRFPDSQSAAEAVEIGRKYRVVAGK